MLDLERALTHIYTKLMSVLIEKIYYYYWKCFHGCLHDDWYCKINSTVLETRNPGNEFAKRFT